MILHSGIFIYGNICQLHLWAVNLVILLSHGHFTWQPKYFMYKHWRLRPWIISMQIYFLLLLIEKEQLLLCETTGRVFINRIPEMLRGFMKWNELFTDNIFKARKTNKFLGNKVLNQSLISHVVTSYPYDLWNVPNRCLLLLLS